MWFGCVQLTIYEPLGQYQQRRYSQIVKQLIWEQQGIYTPSDLRPGDIRPNRLSAGVDRPNTTHYPPFKYPKQYDLTSLGLPFVVYCLRIIIHFSHFTFFFCSQTDSEDSGQDYFPSSFLIVVSCRCLSTNIYPSPAMTTSAPMSI